MNRTRSLPARHAFTLIEVLIAIALALMLGAVMFAFLHDMLATRARMMAFASSQRAATTLIDRIEADLATCIAGDSSNGPGVQGDHGRLRILTRSVMPQLASRGMDDPHALADLLLIEYHHNAQTRAVEASKNSAGRFGDQSGASPRQSIVGEIARVRFRYLVDRQWQASFNSLDAARLPDAVEICVWFNLPDASDEAFASLMEESTSFRSDRGERRGGAVDMTDEDGERLPPPDRRRVIVIPDAAGDEDAEGGFDDR